MEWLKTRIEEHLQSHPRLALVIGIECSGKTTFINQTLQRQRFQGISMDQEFLALLQNPERFQQLHEEWLSHMPNNQPLSPFKSYDLIQMITLSESLDKMSQELQKGRKVAFEGVFANPKLRQMIVDAGRAMSPYGIVCYWMDTPVEVCIQRLRQRGLNSPTQLIIGDLILERSLTEDMIRQHAEVFEPPTSAEGFDAVIKVPYTDKV